MPQGKNLCRLFSSQSSWLVVKRWVTSIEKKTPAAFVPEPTVYGVVKVKDTSAKSNLLGPFVPAVPFVGGAAFGYFRIRFQI